MPRKKSVSTLFPSLKTAECMCWHCQVVLKNVQPYEDIKTVPPFAESAEHEGVTYPHSGAVAVKDLEKALEGGIEALKEYVAERVRKEVETQYKKEAITWILKLKRVPPGDVFKGWLKDKPHPYAAYFDQKKENFDQVIMFLKDFFHIKDKEISKSI